MNMLALRRGSNKANHNFEHKSTDEKLWGLAVLPLALLLESRCRICFVEEISLSADRGSNDM